MTNEQLRLFSADYNAEEKEIDDEVEAEQQQPQVVAVTVAQSELLPA